MAPTKNKPLVLLLDALTWKHALIALAIFVGLLIYVAVAAFTARMIARKFLRGDKDINLPLPVFGGILWPIAPVVISIIALVQFAAVTGFRAAAPKESKESKEDTSNLPEAKIVNR